MVPLWEDWEGITQLEREKRPSKIQLHPWLETDNAGIFGIFPCQADRERASQECFRFGKIGKELLKRETKEREKCSPKIHLHPGLDADKAAGIPTFISEL